MKFYDIFWFSIVAIWVLAIATKNELLRIVAIPLCIGLFLVMNSKAQVEHMNTFYIKMSQSAPTLFPPGLLAKTSHKFQRWFTVFVGILLLLLGLNNLISVL